MTEWFLVTIPLIFVWIVMVIDVSVRPDLSGWSKLAWIVVGALFWPSMILYLLTRPIAGRLDVRDNVRHGSDTPRRGLVEAVLAQRAGKISHAELEERVTALRELPPSR